MKLAFFINRFFYITKKSGQKCKYLNNIKWQLFNIIFKELSIVVNCLRPWSYSTNSMLRPKTGPLNKVAAFSRFVWVSYGLLSIFVPFRTDTGNNRKTFNFTCSWLYTKPIKLVSVVNPQNGVGYIKKRVKIMIREVKKN